MLSGLILERLGETHNGRVGTLLPNDAATLAYGKQVVRELKDAGGYDDADLKMVINTSANKIIRNPVLTVSVRGLLRFRVWP